MYIKIGTEKKETTKNENTKKIVHRNIAGFAATLTDALRENGNVTDESDAGRGLCPALLFRIIFSAATTHSTDDNSELFTRLRVQCTGMHRPLPRHLRHRHTTDIPRRIYSAAGGGDCLLPNCGPAGWEPSGVFRARVSVTKISGTPPSCAISSKSRNFNRFSYDITYPRNKRCFLRHLA